MKTNVMTKEQALVKEIHGAFDSAADTLAAKAESVMVTDGATLNAFFDKAKLAKKLGFDNCEDVKKADRMMENLKKYRLISEYRNKYPYLKFITEEQLDELCGKYGLIYAPIAKYTGTIPAKKLLEIQNGLEKIDANDCPRPTYECTLKEGQRHWSRIYDYSDFGGAYIVRADAEMEGFKFPYLANLTITKIFNAEPVIAAPRSQFTGLDNMKAKGFGFYKVTRKVIPDPVVLQPVNGGYLVLAKWGPEADDELLMIPELN